MDAPRIAIVGRPNVGKSSLLNMIARHRISIVDPTPGVTRDRISVMVDLDPPAELIDAPTKTIELIDTGGYGIYSDDEDDVSAKALRAAVEFQISQAIDHADVIIFLIDAQTGIMPLDESVASILRERGIQDRVMLVANKVDSEKWEAHAFEAASLGFGMPVIISAQNSYNKRTFYETLWNRTPESSGIANPEMKLAIVGKRNAGKSTLVNALAGEDRVIVSEIPGTTRDAVDVRFEIDGRPLIAIDTAGMRKSKSLQDDIEYYSQHRALRSVRRADVVMLLIDATLPISQVDKKLSQEIQEHFRPCVIVVNKWDLVEGQKDRNGQSITSEHYLDYLTEQLRGLDYAPCVFISAMKGEGVRDAVALAFNLYEQAGHRETTGRVNATIQRILERRGPSSRLGKQAKIFFVSQVAVHPPTIVFVVNHADLFDNGYQRYLMNRLREEMPYSEVPIRLLFRDRKRMAIGDLKGGVHRAGNYDDEDDSGEDDLGSLENIENAENIENIDYSAGESDAAPDEASPAGNEPS